MFFDRSIGDHKHSSGALNVASIVLYNRKLLSAQDRESKIKKSLENINILKMSSPEGFDNPLIRREEEKKRLLEQGMSKEIIVLNDFINDRISCFLSEIGCLSQELVTGDSENVLILKKPEVIVKKCIDFI